MSIIAAHLGMLVAMWVALAAIGLVALVGIIRGLQGGFAVEEMTDAVVRPILFDVVPLVVLALLTHLDPTHFILLIWYYVAAVLVIIRYAQKLANALQRK